MKEEKKQEQIEAAENNRRIKQVVINDAGDEEVVALDKVMTQEDATERAVEKETLKLVEETETNETIEKVRRQLSEEDRFLLAHEEKNHRKRVFRIVTMVAVFVFSVIFAAAMGAGLALWDSDKTVHDLRLALFPQQVMASTETVASDVTAADEASQPDTDDDKITAAADKQALESEIESKIEEKKAAEAGSLDPSSEDAAEDNNSSNDEAGDNQSADSIEEANTSDQTDNKSEGADEAGAESEADTTADLAGSITNEISGVSSFSKAGQDDIITNNGETTTVVQYVDPTLNYPASFVSVDESYFTDALFIGDSRLQGFGMWSGLPATYYTAVGFQLYKYETTKVVQTENGKVPIFDAMPYDAFTKVYIKVGLNEMGWGNEQKFEDLYAEFIAKVREREPRAIIYIHGLLPVTAAQSAKGDSHNNDNINARNAALKDFAVTQKAYFIDAGQAVMGADGCLPAEMTSDGIHLKSQYMGVWKQYLMDNAIMIK